VQESALARFNKKCGATPQIQALIRSTLEALAENPDLGYKVPFIIPTFYQMPVDDYKIHYIFDYLELTVLYIGILGVC
jgi:plasmid stabilization system protein ParE